MAANVVVTLVCGLVILAMVGQTAAQSLNDPANQKECNGKFDALLTKLYRSRNDTACANLIRTAFSAQQADCPPTTIGSPTHQCMSKNNTAEYVNSWLSLIVGCEYLYIANRAGAGESEAAFTYDKSKTCFQQQNSWEEFTNYMTGLAGAKSGGATSIASVTFSTIAAAVAFAMMLLLQ